MFFLNWELALIVLAISPTILIISSIFSKFVEEYSKKYQEMIADNTVIAEECFLNIKTLKSFAQEENETTHFKHILDKAYSVAVKKGIASGTYKCSVVALKYLSNFLFFSYIYLFIFENKSQFKIIFS